MPERGTRGYFGPKSLILSLLAWLLSYWYQRIPKYRWMSHTPVRFVTWHQRHRLAQRLSSERLWAPPPNTMQWCLRKMADETDLRSSCSECSCDFYTGDVTSKECKKCGHHPDMHHRAYTHPLRVPATYAEAIKGFNHPQAERPQSQAIQSKSPKGKPFNKFSKLIMRVTLLTAWSSHRDCPRHTRYACCSSSCFHH